MEHRVKKSMVELDMFANAQLAIKDKSVIWKILAIHLLAKTLEVALRLLLVPDTPASVSKVGLEEDVKLKIHAIQTHANTKELA